MGITFLPKESESISRLERVLVSRRILFKKVAIIPANICWSWRRLQDMSRRRLQHVFSVTILRLPRRFQDVLKTFSRPLARRLEDEKLLRWRRLQDVLKTCLEDILRTSWRHYGDKQYTYWEYLYLTNVNVHLTNIYFTNLCLISLRQIQNALIRIHHFNIRLILELKQHLYFIN